MLKLLRVAAYVAAITILASAPLTAQGITGKWITEFDRMVRNENGAVSTTDKARARLTLEQKGDSVLGKWELLNPENGPATPRQLRGTIAGNKVALATEFEATVNINGEQSTRKIEVLYDLTIAGDRLEGTMKNRSADMDIPPRLFSAWRDKP